MDPQSLKKMLVPAVAVAAVIVVAGILFGLGSPPATPGGSGTTSHSHETKAAGPLIPKGADTSDAGMTDTQPNADGAAWRVLANGLKLQDVKEGTGDTVSAGQTVVAHYTGWLASNGVVFDSSRKRGEPIDFSLNRVIEGWKLGIPGMKVGGIRRLYIPWEQAYGVRGSPDGGIPPKADLIFEVKLIAFQ